MKLFICIILAITTGLRIPAKIPRPGGDIHFDSALATYKGAHRVIYFHSSTSHSVLKVDFLPSSSGANEARLEYYFSRNEFAGKDERKQNIWENFENKRYNVGKTVSIHDIIDALDSINRMQVR